MRILVVGGGTGGHVTPIRPVLIELKKLHSQSQMRMIGRRNDGISHIMSDDPNLDGINYIFAGKWRRYHDDSWFQRVTDLKTQFLNLRDLFYLAIGFVQSLWVILRFKPDALFMKGGYVSVPVGLAAKLAGKPFITHDSDALAGLSNRIIGRWAEFNTVAASPEHYPYEVKKIIQVGVPIPASFTPVSAKTQDAAKEELGFDRKTPLVLVMGGSLGAQKINDAMILIAKQLTKKANVVLIAGPKNIDDVTASIKSLGTEVRDRFIVLDFTDKIQAYFSAANVVVARAGATAIAEISALEKPAIYIPAAQLADQQRNSQVMKEAGLMVLEEAAVAENPDKLLVSISQVIDDRKTSDRLVSAAKKYSKNGAAKQLAEVITEIAGT